MKLVTERSLIRTVAARFREQYSGHIRRGELCRFGPHAGISIADVADKLDRLDPETATATDVKGIIGNSSWTRQDCSSCGDSGVDIVEVRGADQDSGVDLVSLCRACLEKALGMFQ